MFQSYNWTVCVVPAEVSIIVVVQLLFIMVMGRLQTEVLLFLVSLLYVFLCSLLYMFLQLSTYFLGKMRERQSLTICCFKKVVQNSTVIWLHDLSVCDLAVLLGNNKRKKKNTTFSNSVRMWLAPKPEHHNGH